MNIKLEKKRPFLYALPMDFLRLQGLTETPIFREKLLPLFQELIRNACVNTGERTSGNEDRSVETLQRFFAGYGLKGEVFRAVEGRGNLVLRVKGRDPQAPSLMFMSHLDVVPAQAADWSSDPFSAEIRNGHVVGRGAVDMLCWTAAQAVGFAEALARAPEGGYPGDLVFLALADEEASGRHGAQYMSENHWDAVKADYMVTELGGFFIPTSRGPSAFLTVGEKGVAWLKLSVRGTPGHGSMPFRADNAALKLAEAARRLAQFTLPLSPHPVYRSMARAMGKTGFERWGLSRGIFTRYFLNRLFRRNPGMARFLQTAGHTSFSPNVLRAGEKINIVADRGEILLDVRFLPGLTQEALEALVRRALGRRLSREFTVEFTEYFTSNISSQDTPLHGAVQELFHQAHPEARLTPLFIGGVTDGRFWRRRGTTVYGFSLFAQDLTMDAFGQRIHGIDEKISLDSLAHSLWFFAQLPENFFSRIKAAAADRPS